jgi:sec-independent protein translocase protein TatA
MDALQPWHIIVVVVLAIVLFGGKKLPELGKGIGEGWKGFKEGLRGIDEPAKPVETAQTTAHAVTPKPEAPTDPIKQ